jgi:sugar (pentulose or hexulose) kinase
VNAVVEHGHRNKTRRAIDSTSALDLPDVPNRLLVVGGGSKNRFLNRLTTKRSGLEVIAGPSECTTIGNFAIQLAAWESGGTNSKGVSAERVTYYAEMLGEQELHQK